MSGWSPRARWVMTLTGCSLVAGVLACGDLPGSGEAGLTLGGPGAGGLDDGAARAPVEPAVEARLDAFVARPAALPRTLGRPPEAAVGALRSHPAVALRPVGAELHAQLPAGAPAHVVLPLLSGGAARVRDVRSGVAVAVRPAGAHAGVPARISTGLTLHERVLPGGGDLVRRVTPEGFEDYAVLPARADAVEGRRGSAGAGAEEPALRWEVDVSAAAGLRLVADVLELLSDDGSPVLRAAAPWVLDAAGTWRAARLTLEGCAADGDPRAPRGRALTPPGAAACTVAVRWDDAGLTYPLLVDPSWTTTGSMTAGRYRHQSTTLESGLVLVTGGLGSGFATLSSAELYDPGANGGVGAFTATASMPGTRYVHGAHRLTDGSVAVVGGYRDTSVIADVARYRPATATWVSHTPLSVARGQFGSAALPDGRVIIAGGVTNLTTNPPGLSALIETYDFAAGGGAGAPSNAGSLYRAVFSGAVTPLPGGDVLMTGGADSSQVAIGLTCRWTGSACPAGPALRRVRAFHAQYLLSDARVHVVGGTNSGGVTEVYDPVARTFADGPDVVNRYTYSAVTTLAGRYILLANDGYTSAPVARAALYDGIGAAVRTLPNLNLARSEAAASALLDDRVLVTGGAPTQTTVTSFAEVLSMSGIGGPCAAADDCLVDACIDNVCCDSACTDPCMACSQGETGQPDGTCAPVLAGQDPRNACLDSGAPACTTDGTCDGAGACRQYPASVGCTPGGCLIDAQCASGFCTDGVCCEARCHGECEGCSAAAKGFGQDGLCEPFRDGTDPDSECPASASVCLATGTCDGQGTCRSFAPPATTCGPAQCVGNRVAGELCDGNGVCALDGVGTDCAPYRCAAAACTTTCAVDGDCATGAWCSGGRCLPQVGPGAACGSAAECGSGFCVDGVCCASSCAGICEACAVPGSEGTCVPVVGQPRGTRGACPGAGAADPCVPATCDGTDRTTCARLPGPETDCGTASCNGDVAVPASSCSGAGTCRAPSPIDCTPYRCSAGACGLSCAADVDCQTGYRCEGARCIPVGASVCAADGITLVDPTGEERTCAPYRCAAGTCINPCVSTTDCVPGIVCQEGVCRDPGNGAAAEETSGCGCRTAGPRGSAWGWLGAVAALTSALRRRRRVT